MKYNETIITLAKCFGEIEALMAIISERLRGSNIPVRALFVEHWQIEVNNRLRYRIWDGFEHRKSLSGDNVLPSYLSDLDILEIFKHKEILMRRF